jgi:DNA polymerase-3 subunit gamma/tau
MEYTVLARKCRPKNFEDVLGQESITRVLRNAIRKNRVAHAYIFSGPRGVGKTSTARVLAKALNCRKGTSENPCNECSNCLEINEGNNMDVIEIDGASNRGIDNIRELRENVKFVPANSPFKVYIIDEVHMLSKEAFNALLKTLEEPPRHIKFIFATTEPHKVPDTILSRCQHFLFKLIPDLVIRDRLVRILEEEKISFDERAADLIARSAEGSMRDAESMLDKVITYCEGTITYADAVDIVGVVNEEVLAGLAEAIAAGSPGKAFDIVQGIIRENKDAYKFVQNLLDFYRDLLVEKLKEQRRDAQSTRLAGLASKFEVHQLIYILELIAALEGRIKNSPSPYVSIEILIVKMAHSGTAVPVEQILRELHSLKKALEHAPDHPAPRPHPAEEVRQEPAAPARPQEVIRPTQEQMQERWKDFLFVVEKKNKHLIRTYLQEGCVAEVDGSTVVLEFQESSVFHLDLLNQPTNIEFIEKEMSAFFNASLKLKFRMVPDTIRKRECEEPAAKPYDPREKIKKMIDDNEVIRESLNLFQGKIVGFKEPEKKSGEDKK